MITYHQGDIMEDGAEALVNPVNCVGAMGKGLALQFKRQLPAMYAEYSRRCARGDVKLGAMDVHEIDGGRLVINFPTKQHWRNQSELRWVRRGLDDLARVIEEMDIDSIAVPRLGCGLGGLDWNEVHEEMLRVFDTDRLDGVDIRIYASNPRVR